jgi:ribonuclease P protein subunit RPR2
MAKPKPESAKKVVHPHLHARLAFLQRAAKVLEEQQHAGGNDQQSAQGSLTNVERENEATAGLFDSKSNALARELSSHTTSIMRKTKLRITPEIKRTICKKCSSKLIEGHSSVSEMENNSRDGKKPWADVLLVTCLSCGMEKRFPKGQTRGTRKKLRKIDCVSRSKKSELEAG